VQSAILGSFYWCYILSQVVGGVLTQRFGTKTVFGFSQLTTAIASLLIPQAASFHYSAVIALRSLQGMASVSMNKNHFKHTCLSTDILFISIYTIYYLGTLLYTTVSQPGDL